MRTCAVLFVPLYLLFSTARADTTWVEGGNVSGYWNADNSPYMLLGNVAIVDSDTLVIQEGCRIIATGPFGFNITGLLHALGVPENLIVFTCDTTVVNHWRGLHFNANSVVQELQYCIVEFAGSSNEFSAIYCYGGLVSLQGCILRENTRAARMLIAGHMTFVDCHIYNNGPGSAIEALSLSSVDMRYCRVHDNTALDGGGFYLSESSLQLTQCDISDNSGIMWGGAIYSEGETVVEAEGCTFQGNTAATGGVYFGWENDDDTQVSFRKCQFIENSVSPTYQMAASVINPASVVEIDGCTFVRNGPGQAGAVRASGNCTISNSIFAFQQNQEAIYSSTGQLQISYCDFYGNEQGDVGGTVPNFFGELDTLNVFGDSCDRSFNLFLDPLFADTSGDDYALTAESPCIDAGDPVSPYDPDNTVADMGALFFDQTTTARDPKRLAVRHWELSQNYPNPFNSSTTISYSLPHASEVTLHVFDITGRVVSTLVEGAQAAGTHSVHFDAGTLPSGIYIYRLQAGSNSQGRKLILLR